ncbi:DUF6660 family protein [Chitinophaga nivalis]|uniref:Uncharacterized protein n=1 Tax=Chitinophaga nivalis TaxID=2991709 RepID=A0ABT3IGP1_9BACT|nr:DUF6660 family protein [Chitinophaga nivalis]MCW3467171.1 hypothetical protein [Chitinophaga nivalis]MCW3483137.1 hypothetical protein [Chitinophaga nivalis]
MKWVAYIMVVLVFMLNCIPCSDSMAAPNRGAGTVVQAASSARTIHMDSCTPFCTCTCCSSIQEPVSIIVYNWLPVAMAAVHADYTTAVTRYIPFKIWQPPRLG